MPAVLLALVLTLFAPTVQADVPPIQPEFDRPPVYLSTDSPVVQSPIDPDAASAAASIVEKIVSHLRVMGLNVIPSGKAGYLISAAGPGGSIAALNGHGSTALLPERAVKLSIGFNGSRVVAASGSETHFGGGEGAWRLADLVQRSVVGGFQEVLGYDIYDRGTVDDDPPPTEIRALATGDAWVSAYPLFATNEWEASLLREPGSQDVLSAAVANAIWSHLDAKLRTPAMVPQLGWRRTPSWQPVEGRAVARSEHSPKVALTFDGGASSAPTPAILKALRDEGVHATIFMTADYAEKNPGLVVQMARDGHEFGNHSSTHPDMTTVSSQEMIAELERLEATVVALTGKSTRPWFRPPFGAYNDRVLRVAGEEGYESIMWTADSADWRNDVDAAIVEARLLRYAEPGAIMIEHLGSPQSAQVLPEVLRVLKSRGLSFGTLSEVLGAP